MWPVIFGDQCHKKRLLNKVEGRPLALEECPNHRKVDEVRMGHSGVETLKTYGEINGQSELTMGRRTRGAVLRGTRRKLERSNAWLKNRAGGELTSCTLLAVLDTSNSI